MEISTMLQRTSALLAALAAILLLTSCTGGKPKVRINPPTVSVQELRIDNAQCRLLVRIQNHSTVSMRYSALRFDRMTLDGRELAPVNVSPDLDVAPYTGEPFVHEMACPGMTPDASEIMYRLGGRIDAVEPGRRGFDFDHRSRLLPVPGLTGVYR
jgi:hypothetical protein